MHLNKFPLSAFLQQSLFFSFSTKSYYAFEQIPFICFSRYLHVGYYFSTKFQQNLTTLLNKFPLTCFSRWLPFFKQIPTKSYYFEQIPFDMLFKIFSSWLPFFKREDHFKFEFEMMLSSGSISPSLGTICYVNVSKISMFF